MYFLPILTIGAILFATLFILFGFTAKARFSASEFKQVIIDPRYDGQPLGTVNFLFKFEIPEFVFFMIPFRKVNHEIPGTKLPGLEISFFDRQSLKPIPLTMETVLLFWYKSIPQLHSSLVVSNLTTSKFNPAHNIDFYTAASNKLKDIIDIGEHDSAFLRSLMKNKDAATGVFAAACAFYPEYETRFNHLLNISFTTN